MRRLFLNSAVLAIKRIFGNSAVLAIKRIFGKGQKVPPTMSTQKYQLQDDYDWQVYTNEYRSQISELENEYTLKLKEGDFYLRSGRLILHDEVSMHPNHICLYEVLGTLNPSDVLEIGCGGGDHLYNIGVLYPHIKRHGFDRSKAQLEFLKRRSPGLEKCCQLVDITMPFSNKWPSVSVVYSQAVIMHILTGNSHLVALSNMFRLAKDTVVLMENYKCHNFYADIIKLYSLGCIEWEHLNFYYHNYDERPHIMIVSNNELRFPDLSNYSLLVDAMEWSPPE